MIWSDAFKLLKQGKFVKLPSWTGYWSWDEEKKNVVMHCKPDEFGEQKNILLTDSKNMDYTLSNIASDEWLEATPENCTLLGGITLFTWKMAASYALKNPKVKIGCCHWNKDTYIQGTQEGEIKLYYPAIYDAPLSRQESMKGLMKYKEWIPTAKDMVLDDFYFID